MNRSMKCSSKKYHYHLPKKEYLSTCDECLETYIFDDYYSWHYRWKVICKCRKCQNKYCCVDLYDNVCAYCQDIDHSKLSKNDKKTKKN